MDQKNEKIKKLVRSEVRASKVLSLKFSMTISSFYLMICEEKDKESEDIIFKNKTTKETNKTTSTLSMEESQRPGSTKNTTSNIKVLKPYACFDLPDMNNAAAKNEQDIND